MTVKGDTQVSPEQEYWCFFHENGTYSDGHGEKSLERVRQGGGFRLRRCGYDSDLHSVDTLSLRKPFHMFQWIVRLKTVDTGTVARVSPCRLSCLQQGTLASYCKLRLRAFFFLTVF